MDTEGEQPPERVDPPPATFRIGDDDVIIRDFRPGDEAQVVEVYTHAFGSFFPAEKPVDPHAFLRWFTERHDSHQGRITLAEIGGRIVSVSGLATREIKLGNRILYGGAGAIGVVTLPEYQGRGIKSRRSDWYYETLRPPVTAALVRADPRRVHLDRLRFPGRMGVHFRPLRSWGAAADGSGAALPRLPVISALIAWGHLRSRIGRARPAGTLSTWKTFDERFDPFWEAVVGDWDFIPIRSREFLNWRFCDDRAGTFIVRAFEDEGRLLGYAALHSLGARGHIVDLLALPGRLDVVRALVDDAVRQFRQEGLSGVECWMLRGQPYAKALTAAGFVVLRGRSRQEVEQIGIDGPGLGPAERAALAAPGATAHLVRADFDGM